MSEQKETAKRPLLMNFFIDTLRRQTERDLKKAMPNNTYGKLVSVYFLVDKNESVIERMKFENYMGDQSLKEEQKKKFEKTLSINIHNEMTGNNKFKKKCRNIICKIDIPTKAVYITWNFEDGTNYELTL